MTSPDFSRQLGALTRVDAGDHRVVSCYLKLEPRDRARNKYFIKLKNRIAQVQAAVTGLGLPRKTREEVRADLDRVLAYLKNPVNLPGTRGVAVFASGPLKLFEAMPLPRVYRSRLAVDRTPLVRELASIEDEVGRMLTAVTDRTGARFFEVTAFTIDEVIGVRADYSRGHRWHGEKYGWSGESEHDFHSRIREEKQRHYAHVAQQLFQFHQRHPYFGFVLAGNGADAAAVRPFLHPYLANKVLGVVKLNPKDLDLQAVWSATLDAREEWERAEEREAVQAMEDAGNGWAVNGVDATLRSLALGQVRTLLVQADAAEAGFRCLDSGRLSRDDRDCRDEGGAVPVLDIVDEAIEEALRQRVTVNVVYDAVAGKKIDGLAGLLRFK